MTSAQNDFQQNTGIAKKMNTEYGMRDKMGPMHLSSGDSEVLLVRDFKTDKHYSDAIAYLIDKEIQDIINSCYERAKQILTEHKEQLDVIAQTLLEIETLDAKQIKSLFEDGILPPEDDSSD